MTNAVEIFEVGGAVRDELMGVSSSDVDFSVAGLPSLDALTAWVADEVGEVVKVKDEFLTVRAVVRKGHPLAERTRAADFVLCRKDSATSDGRRPDFVEPGDIFDDLARRDFTVNAIAKSVATGEVLDPHGGRQDLRDGVLRFVGSPIVRIREDGMRVLRGLRFMVTKGFTPHADTFDALRSTEAADMLAAQKVEPMFEEVRKMMRADTMRALSVLGDFPNLTPVIFRDGLHLDASLAEH